MGCRIAVEMKDGEVIKTENAQCGRGRDYSLQELRSPVRDFFTTVRVAGGKIPVVSVRSTGPVPKSMLMACAVELAEIVIPAPVKNGDVIVINMKNLGVDIVATKDVDKA